MLSPEDTIAAPATAQGEAALAMVRASGPDCPHLLRAIFAGSAQAAPLRARVGRYRSIDGAVLDQVVYLPYPAGASYTGEDMLEITCHGNPFIVRKILDDLLQRGCRLAEPGEFSRRAFLNGRIDLSQAEAVADLIRARSDRALQAARRQLEGSVGRVVKSLADNILLTSVAIEAYIDFPDEDLPPEDVDGPRMALHRIAGEMDRLMATSQYSHLLHAGVRTVIAGPPNVGKSSLLNALTGEDRVIVSAEPGTTRDYIEDRILVGPYLLRVVDTAGLRDAATGLELAGIERSLEQVRRADLVLLVVDATQPHPALADAFRSALRDKQVILVENKIDLGKRVQANPALAGFPAVAISALHGTGLDALRASLLQAIEAGMIVPDPEAVLVSARHAQALTEAQAAIHSALDKMAEGIAAELIASDLRLAIEAMGAITGRIDNEAMLDALFAHFCIGK